MADGPEKKFQKHIAAFLKKGHHYIPLDPSDLIDPDWYFLEDHLLAFIRATQKETYTALEENYGSDSGDEIFKALKKVLNPSFRTVINKSYNYSNLYF